ncbi:ankyrin repeat-containing domain protein [Aspergillus heterothallicus]
MMVWGIVHYDKGKSTDEGFQIVSHLSKPPPWLLGKVASLQSDQMTPKGTSMMIEYVRDVQEQVSQEEYLIDYVFPGRDNDRLFPPDTPHIGGENCSQCDTSALVARRPRDDPAVHYGLIASGSQIIKSAKRRDELRVQRNILCFETEAVGLMDDFPCLVIRGISDYADSHKDDLWQGYAAITSAAYARDLLRTIESQEVEEKETAIKVTERFVETVAAIEGRISAINTANDQGRIEELLNWLSPLENSDEQAAYFEKMAENTGKWFLDSVEFQRLIHQSEVTLYCHGIPGSGKSSLISLAIDYLYNLRRKDTGIGIAYIFFSFTREDVQAPTDLLASLAKQLARLHPSPLQVLEDLYERKYKKKQRPSAGEIAELLKRLIGGFRVAVIVLDALDECKSPTGVLEKLMQCLFQLQEEVEGSTLNILATSRTNHNIEALFEKATHTVEIHAQDEDIIKYLQAELNCVMRDKMDQALREEAQDRILKAADGMFLIVRLHMNHILTLPTKGHIKDALKTLSHGVDGLSDLYSAAMKRLNYRGQATQELARAILSWVVHAKRPLTVWELQDALAIRPDTRALDRSLIRKYFANIGHLQSVCEGLIEVNSRDIVRLAHYTTYEYFSQSPTPWMMSAQPHIARMCLTYLSYDVFETQVRLRRLDDTTRLLYYPFYGYCCLNWGYHVKDAGIETANAVLSLLTNEHKLKSCSNEMLKLSEPFEDPEDAYYEISCLPSMHVAALFGMIGTLERLVELGGDLDVKDDAGNTPLSRAVVCAEYHVVRWLLNTGRVDINAADWLGNTPLIKAIYVGNQYIIRLLIECGHADPAHRNDNGETALHIACWAGEAAVVQMLLDTGVLDVNAEDYDSWTPLSIAAGGSGDPATTKLLVETEGIAVNGQEGAGQVPLVSAAGSGTVSVVDVLLSAKGIDVNRSDEFGTALYAAAENGHEDVVRSLLRAPGIDVNYRRWVKAPLEVAIDKDNVTMVKLLLDSSRIDTNGLNSFNKTPLMYAADKGQESVVQLLLSEYDVDITKQDACGRTALDFATQSGHSSVACLLQDFLRKTSQPLLCEDHVEPSILRSGSHSPTLDIHLLQDQCQIIIDSRHSSCHPSSPRNHADTTQISDVMDTTLDHIPIQHLAAEALQVSADQRSNWSEQQTDELVTLREAIVQESALFAAETYADAQRCPLKLDNEDFNLELVFTIVLDDTEAVGALLEQGLSPNHRIDENESTLLLKAVQFNGPGVIGLVLKNHADPNAMNSKGISPLHTASAVGTVKIVRLLLEHGADINLGGDLGITPLAVAIKLENLKVARYLVENGALLR